MATINYLTPEGLQKLKEEVAYLTTHARADISKQIGEAREKGDLSENAEYDAAKEAQGLLEARISKLQESLANARLLDDVDLDSSKALILSTVEVKNIKLGKVQTFTLVSENEADLKTGRLSVTSPIGKGLLGKSVGDVAEVTTPAGTIQFEILSIARL
ncbi:transcription elongation factor GreA [soil metagenome]